MFREGLLVVVSGPSGAGKGTVLNVVRQKEENIRFSISATTRAPRSGEEDGVNYFFRTHEEFQDMINKDQLLEWVKYCDNYYGTPKTYVEETVGNGYDCLLEVEVEGALNVKARYPECVSVFILPPSFEELKRRIEGRGTEKPEVIKKRMDKARKEVELAHKYDYIIINDDIYSAARNLMSIMAAEKFKSIRNKNIIKSIQGME